VVQKCANPSCSATFRRLGEGRLFAAEAAGDGRSRRLEYFWLCNSCSRTMTVAPTYVSGTKCYLCVDPLTS
jgi:hypothetical protein